MTEQNQSTVVTDELLPCPFCGGPAEVIEGEECAYVQCLDMKMHRALWFDGDNAAADEVREQWNRRTEAALPFAPVVTDEMVERAKQAVWNTDAPEYQRDYLQYDHIMRAALEAAQLPARPVAKGMSDTAWYQWLYPFVGDDGQTRNLIAEMKHQFGLSALEGEGE